jgi:hypothetical protein
MRTLPLTCKEPAAWLNDYKINSMPKLEFFTCLTGCIVSAEPSDVANSVPDELKNEYREHIQGIAAFKSDDDLIFINGPRIFGLREVRLMHEWYLSHPAQ